MQSNDISNFTIGYSGSYFPGFTDYSTIHFDNNFKPQEKESSPVEQTINKTTKKPKKINDSKRNLINLKGIIKNLNIGNIKIKEVKGEITIKINN